MSILRLVLTKIVRLGGVLLFLLAGCRPASNPEWQREGWRLVWHDEFDGENINPEYWTFDIGGSGWGNNEWQFYTDRPENVRIEDGVLVIEARREEYLHRDYTSARIKTQGLYAWTYGRIEARIQLPYGNGIWPAFWMLGEDINSAGWPVCGEIDIMEHIGREPTRVYGTVHGPGYSGGNGVGGSLSLTTGSLYDEFHIYAIEWDPAEIRWYVDDQQYFQVTPNDLPGQWVYDHPFFIILNLAVGGNWPGYPDETTVFPQFLRVDYVRVYQRSDSSGQDTGRVRTMHLGEISVVARENENGTWQAIATITVVDEDGNPVEGATVTGGWVGTIVYGETEAVTDATGTVHLASDPSERSGQVTFCVTDVSHPRLVYDKAANARNCGVTER